MNEQSKNSPNKLPDLGSRHERKQQRELCKRMKEAADHAAKKYLKKADRAAKKRSKKADKRFSMMFEQFDKRLAALEKGATRPSNPDRDKNGFFQLRRR